MLIHDIADFLVNLTCKDIKPDIYSVFDSPCENNCPNNVNSEKLTILEILNAIGCRLKNLFGFVKINTTTETIDEGEAAVNVSGDADNLNFDFKIPRGKTGPQGPQGEPGQTNLVVITASASAQGEYIPDTTYSKALADIQANKAVMIKLENVPGRYYIPYSSSNTEILASAGTVSGSKQSIELYTLKWTAQTNIITLTGTKKGCIADGGTTGQVLVKKSDESFDTEWKFQYRVILSNQPFNTAELIEEFNNGVLIYVYNNGDLFTIYAATKDALYGFNKTLIDDATNRLRFNKCRLDKDNTFIIFSDFLYGIPKGGTTGQILAKKSNTNYDTEWIDNSGGGSTVSVNVGETATGEPGTNASVTNSGDETNVVLNFTIPRGDTGPQGPQGKQGPAGAPGPAGPGVATGGTTGQVLAKKSNASFDTEWVDLTSGGTVSVNVGKTATGEPGTNASVTNSGDETNVVLNFTIPRGDTGPQGPQGKPGSDGKTGPQGPAGPGVATGGTTGQVLAKKSNASFDTEWVDNCPYWIGDILTTMNEINPAQRWPGTAWEQITDCMLRAADDTHPAGSTGGSWEVTQTLEQLVKHTHGYASYQQGYPATFSEGDLYITPIGRVPYNERVQAGTESSPTGGNKPMPITNKYTACYMWKRTR